MITLKEIWETLKKEKKRGFIDYLKNFNDLFVVYDGWGGNWTITKEQLKVYFEMWKKDKMFLDSLGYDTFYKFLLKGVKN